MTCDPHLLFADVSLDIKRGEYLSALEKLTDMQRWFPESYLFHLLFARASRGLKRFDQAVRHLGHCCRIAPANQVAWQELIEVKTLQSRSPEQEPEPEMIPDSDAVADEFERLSIALASFTPPCTSESHDPTPIAEQKKHFPDDTAIAVPTESLARLFITQKAYKKAIRVYTSLIQLNPSEADCYRETIDRLLEKL
jgi:tetratricopeptide (TPR) repeat protein